VERIEGGMRVSRRETGEAAPITLHGLPLSWLRACSASGRLSTVVLRALFAVAACVVAVACGVTG